MDIRTIQLMLGHADIKQTQRYLNITDEELRKAMTGVWERRHCGRGLSPLEPLPIVSQLSVGLRKVERPAGLEPASGFDHDERVGDAVAKFGNRVDDRLSERGPHACREANQNDTSRVLSVRVRQLAEVLLQSKERDVENARSRGPLRPTRQE